MYPQRKPVEPIIEELISDTNVGYTDLINIPSTIGAKTTKVFKIIETTSPGLLLTFLLLLSPQLLSP
ncbi:MAG: hypothetical protein V2A53_01600 [bacterium]